MGSEKTFSARFRISDKISETIARSVSSATSVAHAGLDQVLLGLQHKGLHIKKAEDLLANDVVQTIGRKILERAEAIRAQLATQPMSPSWLKDISLTRPPEIGSQSGPENSIGPAVADAASQAASREANQVAKDAAEAMSAADDVLRASTVDVLDSTETAANEQHAMAELAGSVSEKSISSAAMKMQPESHSEAVSEAKQKAKPKAKRKMVGRKVGAVKKAGSKASSKALTKKSKQTFGAGDQLPLAAHVAHKSKKSKSSHLASKRPSK